MQPTLRTLSTSFARVLWLGALLPLTVLAAEPGGSRPPTPVTAAEVIQETIQEWQEFTGRLRLRSE